MGHIKRGAGWPDATISIQRPADARAAASAPVILVAAGPELRDVMQQVCAFLRIELRLAADPDEVWRQMRDGLPLAVIARTDKAPEPGCALMKLVARYDRGLPLLLVAGRDPTILGTLDAIEDLCRLTGVMRIASAEDVDAIMEFMFRAGRRAGIGRMMRL